MSITIIQNPGGVGLVGAIAMWHGTADAMPDGWEAYEPAKDAYIKGGNTANIEDVPEGSHAHDHVNQNTNNQPAHSHTVNGGSSSSSSNTISTGYSGGGSDIANPHSHSSVSGNVNSAGLHSHPNPDTEEADIRPPSKGLYFIRWIAGGDIPVGVITLWSENEADIPGDWQLADGTNGTLDMTDQFVYGAEVDGDVGAAEGAATHTHGNGNTNPAGEHTHPYSGSMSGGIATSPNGFPSGHYSVADGSHNHSTSGSTSNNSNHEHAINDTEAEASIPEHMLLYFIEKVA